jgi:hypothetical protein
MPHVLTQLSPFFFSYPIWILLSAILWVCGHLSQRGESLRMYAALAIVVAAGMFLWQMH